MVLVLLQVVAEPGSLDLSDFVRELFECGLRKRFPDLDEPAFRRLLHERLDRCHNRNF